MTRRRTSDASRKKLLDEFDGKCVYCLVSLSENGVTTHHFIPKTIRQNYPQAFDALIPVCMQCHMLLDTRHLPSPDSESSLINPRTERLEDHIDFQPDGLAVGLTPKGTFTVDFMRLNRPQLVEMRRAEIQATDYFRELDLHLPERLKMFHSSLRTIRSLNAGLAQGGRLKVVEVESVFLRNMLFANVITALETYLCDTLIGLVMRDEKSLRLFVASFLDFSKEKFELRHIFDKYDLIEDLSRKALRDIIYHDLPKVAGIYKDAFGIELADFGELAKSILVRHDIVHRNGKTKEGEFHSITESQIEILCTRAETFVSNVDQQVEALFETENGT